MLKWLWMLVALLLVTTGCKVVVQADSTLR